jgi:hypothetical protein
MSVGAGEGSMTGVRTSKLLWPALLLLALSIVLLVYPVETRLEYRPIQSPDAIVNIPLFALLFCTWMALLLLLLWRAKGSVWGIALVVVFAVVYLGFWTVHLPRGIYEDWWKMSDIPRIQQEDHIPSMQLEERDFEGHPGYLDFPGMAVWGASISEVTGQGIVELRGALVLSAMAILALLLLAFYRRSLGPGPIALLAVVLAIMANAMLARFHFHPAYIVLVLLAAVLVLLARAQQAGGMTQQDKVLFILLAGVATITHFVTSVLLFLIAGILYLFHLLRRRHEQSPLQVGGVVLLLALPLAWSMYWAMQHLFFTVGEMGDFYFRVTEGDILWYVGAIGSSNVEQAPFWANITRLGWLGGFYGLALVLALLAILRLRKVTGPEGYIALILIAVAIITAGSALLHYGGEQYYRLIAYGSFLAAPLILLRALQLRRKALVLGAITALTLVVSLPTFLAHNNLVSTASYYPSEVAAGKFLHAATGGRDDQMFLSVVASGEVAFYYNSRSELRSFGEFVAVRNESELLEQANEFAAWWAFWREGFPHRYKVVCVSRKFEMLSAHWLGKEAGQAAMDALNGQLAKTDRFYDNGMEQFYQ